jgi:hypothetical protein
MHTAYSLHASFENYVATIRLLSGAVPCRNLQYMDKTSPGKLKLDAQSSLFRKIFFCNPSRV